MVSSKDTSFKQDLGFAKDKSVLPGVSVFIKNEDKIYRVSNTYFGPGDEFCIIWNMLDLLPKEISNWSPKLKY